MKRPKFTVKCYGDKYINLYGLKKDGKTIAQIELRQKRILIYPLYKNILFIHRGILKDSQEGS